MSEPTREQKCADLARKIFPGCEIMVSSNGVEYLPPRGAGTWRTFNPYESADDSRALVEWLTTQPNKVSHVFIAAVFQSLWPLRPIFVSSAEMDVAMVFRLMTAPPPVIADAAWLAITSTEQPKAS